MPVETTTSNALILCDGLGDYDLSDQAKEGPTNYALMAYSSSSSDSKVSNDSTCSKYCLEIVKVLKSQYEQLLKRFEKSELMVVAYKTSLQKKVEIVQKEKDGIQFNVDKLKNASKSLNKIIESQIVDNYKKGLSYNVVPPPLTGNFMPPKPNLSFTGLEEFTIESVVSDSEEDDVPQTEKEKKIVKSSFAKIEFVKSKEQVKSPRKTTVKQVNSARPMKNVFNKTHSTVRRSINNKTVTKNSNFNKRVNTVSGKNVNTVRQKAVVNTAKPKAVLNAVKGNQGNPQMDLQDQGVIDSGCSRHMTENMSYLTDFEEIDERYLRELQFNLFSVSQMCDKKNSVLFNDTECIVLSSNFKLTDENHVLLKVPRKNNMYSVDIKNIVPKGGLTCLFEKATSDESKL
ncbi:hypothetical protein Tco_0817716 [Tanacetum coccineum]